MLNFNDCVFLRSAADTKSVPDDGRPQIVFAGRSNVGKSSVINCITARKNLARVGQTPGKTAQINLFTLAKKFYLVDLPGYGYAKVSKQERDRWANLIEGYFASERNIALGVLIVDSRHSPTDDDTMMKDYFENAGIPFVVVANKADKLNKTEQKAAPAMVADALEIESDNVALFSAEKGLGREALIRVIADALETGK